MVFEQGKILRICLRYVYKENYIATTTIIHTICTFYYKYADSSL
jgi:hypothetical protein